jgi:4-hydroxybenzoate polyprenyltransferase
MQIRVFAGRILAARHNRLPLGKKWMAGFFRQNPVLKTKKQLRIDPACVNSAIFDILKAWFQKLKIPAIKAIKPENRWNMDKAGIIKGQGLNSLVVRSAQKRFI